MKWIILLMLFGGALALAWAVVRVPDEARVIRGQLWSDTKMLWEWAREKLRNLR